MRGVTEAKGLGDLRTAISHRVRANPPQQGNAYLEIYILDKERQRLQTELSRLQHRAAQINKRLAKIGRDLETLHHAANGTEIVMPDGAPPGHESPFSPPASAGRLGGAPAAPRRPAGRSAASQASWRRMTIDY